MHKKYRFELSRSGKYSFVLSHSGKYRFELSCSGKYRPFQETNVCMCYESHAQSGSACTTRVLLQSSSYIILHSRCAMTAHLKRFRCVPACARAIACLR